MKKRTYLCQTRIQNLFANQPLQSSSQSGRLTNVDYVPFSIDHNITIVPIFDLEYIAGHRIGSHGLNKVQTGSLECNRVLASIFCDEKVQKIINFSAAHFVPRSCVGNNIDNTTLQRE